MTRAGLHTRLRAFLAEDSGAAMVEFAIVCMVFFLAFFQLLGFGIFASNNLMAEKATQVAARIAVARPAVCGGVPDRILTSDLAEPPRFGTNCRNAADTCTPPNNDVPYSCTGSAANANDTSTTDGEIWTLIEPMLPGDVEITDLAFTYTFDENLGYLGGPYTPMVTVALTVPNDNTEMIGLFNLVGRLAQAAGGGTGTAFSAPQYRVISISLPAEDLNSGTDG